jgi:hypothetical protein
VCVCERGGCMLGWVLVLTARVLFRPVVCFGTVNGPRGVFHDSGVFTTVENRDLSKAYRDKHTVFSTDLPKLQ